MGIPSDPNSAPLPEAEIYKQGVGTWGGTIYQYVYVRNVFTHARTTCLYIHIDGLGHIPPAFQHL